MKLSVLAPEKAGEMIPLIARYANSQNKVNDADFSPTTCITRLEEISRGLETPPASGVQYGTHWFYERARGQFLNQETGLTRAMKEQFLLKNPKSQLLTKTDIAKLENTAWLSP
ncbi:MAG: AIPR family protein [Burkholderiales bacterium]|nr:AIPR family protein [Burkholderiales bacterium]